MNRFIILICILIGILIARVLYTKSRVARQRQISANQIRKFNEATATRVVDPIELSDLYINGVPDSYDILGNRIKGVAPSPKHAINALQSALNSGNRSAYVKLAKIYHYGLGNLQPDLNLAKKYYKNALASSDYISRLIASEKLNEISQQMEMEMEMPEMPVFSLFNLPFIKPAIDEGVTPWSFIEPSYTPFMRHSAPIHINTIFRVSPEDNLQQRVINPVTDGPVPAHADSRGIANDMHNVHDHSVFATIKSSYEKLHSETQIHIPKNKCIQELRDFVKSYLKQDKKNDALTALNAVERNFIPHTGLDATESDMIAIVWNRMNSKFRDNHEIQKTIKENLANGLAEMIEHGKVCCVTGRLSRILDSLNIIDDAVQIKPTFAINQEMMDKAAKISTSVVEEAPDNVQKDYNNAKDTPDVTALTDKIRQTIRTELEKDYVKSGILTPEGFESQISKWINEI